MLLRDGDSVTPPSLPSAATSRFATASRGRRYSVLVQRVEIDPRIGGGLIATAPALWYVIELQPDAYPPAVTLVAFDGQVDGAVLGTVQAEAADATPEGQSPPCAGGPGAARSSSCSCNRPGVVDGSATR